MNPPANFSPRPESLVAGQGVYLPLELGFVSVRATGGSESVFEGGIRSSIDLETRTRWRSRITHRSGRGAWGAPPWGVPRGNLGASSQVRACFGPDSMGHQRSEVTRPRDQGADSAKAQVRARFHPQLSPTLSTSVLRPCITAGQRLFPAIPHACVPTRSPSLRTSSDQGLPQLSPSSGAAHYVNDPSRSDPASVPSSVPLPRSSRPSPAQGLLTMCPLPGKIWTLSRMYARGKTPSDQGIYPST